MRTRYQNNGGFAARVGRLRRSAPTFQHFQDLLQIDSLRSPFGLPAAVFLRSAPILPSCLKIRFRVQLTAKPHFLLRVLRAL